MLDDVEWKKLKRETKERLMADYVSTIKKRYDLTREQQLQFEMKLNISFQLHLIDSDEIILEKGKIVDIVSVVYDDRSREFIFPKTSFVDEKDVSADRTASKLMQSVKKFIQHHSSRVALKLHKRE
jgi:hypothetical protein